MQEVVVVAESATNNPAFLPTPSVENRVHARGKSVKKVDFGFGFSGTMVAMD